ncbi:OB-fold-containig protein [Stakelama marina]|nr:OB-fold-containig protein [Stakelama marina]
MLDPANLPFAVALALMLMLALSQLIGLGDMLGGADTDIDVDMGADMPESGSIPDGMLTLLGLGRLPLMMWLALLLFLFAALGSGIQAVATHLAGAPFSPLPAALLALVPAVPLTGILARPLSRVMPHDETTAVGLDTLIGRRGVIVIGRATAGSAARARVVDRYGQPHHVMVEPHDRDAVLAEEAQVLMVRRDGETFFAVALDDNPFTTR